MKHSSRKMGLQQLAYSRQMFHIVTSCIFPWVWHNAICPKALCATTFRAHRKLLHRLAKVAECPISLPACKPSKSLSLQMIEAVQAIHSTGLVELSYRSPQAWHSIIWLQASSFKSRLCAPRITWTKPLPALYSTSNSHPGSHLCQILTKCCHQQRICSRFTTPLYWWLTQPERHSYKPGVCRNEQSQRLLVCMQLPHSR